VVLFVLFAVLLVILGIASAWLTINRQREQILNLEIRVINARGQADIMAYFMSQQYATDKLSPSQTNSAYVRRVLRGAVEKTLALSVDEVHALRAKGTQQWYSKQLAIAQSMGLGCHPDPDSPHLAARH
jgi:hypothetical protein